METLEKISTYIPFIIVGWFCLWVLFAYYTFRLSIGIKKSLGSNYYLLPNKWPNSRDNPEIRNSIKSSPELTKLNKVKTISFIALLSYLAFIIIPIFIVAFYIGY